MQQSHSILLNLFFTEANLKIFIMIKLIIFDFDSTLAGSQEIILSVFNKIAINYNFGIINNDSLQKVITTFVLSNEIYV